MDDNDTRYHGQLRRIVDEFTWNDTGARGNKDMDRTVVYITRRLGTRQRSPFLYVGNRMGSGVRPGVIRVDALQGDNIQFRIVRADGTFSASITRPRDYVFKEALFCPNGWPHLAEPDHPFFLPTRQQMRDTYRATVDPSVPTRLAATGADVPVARVNAFLRNLALTRQARRGLATRPPARPRGPLPFATTRRCDRPGLVGARARPADAACTRQ